MSDWLPQEAGENSLWAETASMAPDLPVLTGEHQADVLVVGAGFTGLSTALHLAERGRSVALVEAGRVGFGGSGRNAGLVNAGVWKTPEHVCGKLGEEAGQRFNQALRDSPEAVFSLVERLGIDCQARRCGTLHIAHSSAGLDYLRERCRQLAAIGADVELLDGGAAKTLSGSPAYRYGAILHADAGTIQPLSYVRGLASAAIAAGVVINQESPLKGLARTSDGWQGVTDGGRIDAGQVVLATNAYADAGSAGVQESTLPVYIFHFATAPLPADLAASIIPERHGLWDTHTLLTSSRIDADGRLVMSFPGRLQGGQRPTREGWATRRRDHLYPQLRGIPWAHAWTGRIGVTRNNILRVQRPEPGIFAPAGFNGRGIGTGTVIGQRLAELLDGGNDADFPFPLEPLARESFRGPRAAWYDLGTLTLQAVSQRLG